MTAVTDTRKRSRDEDTCDFMPISKRINNLSLSSHGLGEADLAAVPNLATNYLMAINDQDHTNNYPHQSNNYPNQVQINYGNYHHMNGHGHTQHPHSHSSHHQSHIQHQLHHQSTAHHSNGFNNSSHLASVTNEYNLHIKSNQVQMHPHQHPHHSTTVDELNNNEMDIYCPELTADENPFYYNKNKLLFDLHIERQRRNQNSP